MSPPPGGLDLELVKISSPAAGKILEDLSTWKCERCRHRYQCPDAFLEEYRDGCEYFISDRITREGATC